MRDGDDAPPPPPGGYPPKAIELLKERRHFPAVAFAERWESSKLGQPIDLPTWVRTETRLTINPSDWTRDLTVLYHEPPPEMLKDLRELTPQAILRDLHRPVKSFFYTPTPIEGTEVVGQLGEAWKLLQAARVVEARPHIPATIGAFREEQERRRAFLAEHWQPLLDDDAPRKKLHEWGGITDPDEAPPEQAEGADFYVPDFAKYEKERKEGKF